MNSSNTFKGGTTITIEEIHQPTCSSTPSTSSIQCNNQLVTPEDSAKTKAAFYSTYLSRQPFSLPNSLIYYILKNPTSSKLYQKLIQSCKFFFVLNPILVISSLSYNNKCDGWHIWKSNNEWKSIDLPNLSRNTKLWITNDLTFFDISHQQNLASNITQKIYRCNLKYLHLENQIITFDELEFLASGIQDLGLDKVIVKDKENGSVMAFEQVFAAFTTVKKVIFVNALPSASSSITSATFNELLKLPHFSTLDICCLGKIPEDFDIDSFYAYMKKNQRTRFVLDFADSISTEYKKRVEEIIDEIFVSDSHNFKLPFLYFRGLDLAKVKKLKQIYGLS